MIIIKNYNPGIDQEFEKLLVRIFGPELVDSFKLKRPSGWIDLMTAFESRKRSAHPSKENPLNVALPFSLIEFYKKNKVVIYSFIIIYHILFCFF